MKGDNLYKKHTNHACTDSNFLYKTKIKIRDGSIEEKKQNHVTDPVLWKANITRALPIEK